MKKFFLILLVFIFLANPVLAIELLDALKQAYNNNKELQAERENIQLSKEDLAISKSDYLPSATITGSKSKESTNKLTKQSGGDAAIGDVDPLTTSIKIEQILLDKTRDAQYQKNEIGIKLSETILLKKEQDIFYKSIQAYTGLILANEKLNINSRNLNLLRRQVETDQIRLERGQITISDLAQSESSLAGAEAQFIQSKNEVITNKLNYENIIGKISKTNELNKSLTAIVSLPMSLSNAINLSKKHNPDINIANLKLKQSDKDISIAQSDLSPTATLSFEKSYSDDFSSTYDKREKDILKATVSWPFYSGGKKRSKIIKNQTIKFRNRLLLENAIKTTETNVGSAWSNLESSKSFLKSVRIQVKAAEIANEGIAAEYERGSRTTLDVIQSNTLLLNAEISLANAERDYLLAQYNLLKSIGLLNSTYLGAK